MYLETPFYFTTLFFITFSKKSNGKHTNHKNHAERDCVMILTQTKTNQYTLLRVSRTWKEKRENRVKAVTGWVSCKVLRYHFEASNYNKPLFKNISGGKTYVLPLF